MAESAYDIIAKYTKTNEPMQVKRPKDKEGRVDMCRAITELINRGRMEGMKSGIEQGESRLIALLQALMDAGRSEDVSRAISDPEYRKQLYLENA